MQDEIKTESKTANLSGRVAEIAQEAGGPTRLGRLSGLSHSTIHSYIEGESEPGGAALVKLAKAAEVSLEWLATGNGPKKPRPPLPEDCVFLPLVDLTARGNLLHVFFDRTALGEQRLFHRNDLLDARGVAGARVTAVRTSAGADFPPIVAAGDIIVIDQPLQPFAHRPVSDWDWSTLRESGVYLVAIGSWLKLRRIARRKASVLVLRPDGKPDLTLRGMPPADFLLIGRCIWRAGPLL